MENTKVEEQEMVTITKKEYLSLVQDSHWLGCLENAGVDNWNGIDFAFDSLNGVED